MDLTTQYLVKEKYKGSTKFDFWKELRTGDLIKITMPLDKTRTLPTIKFEANGSVFEAKLRVAMNYISNIELVKLTKD